MATATKKREAKAEPATAAPGLEDKSERVIVSRYLESLQARRPRRGRPPAPVPVEKLQARVDEIVAELGRPVSALQRLRLTQERLELQACIEGRDRGPELSVGDEALTETFIAVAASYSARRGIEWETWREVGVPTQVLRRAGIHRRSS